MLIDSQVASLVADAQRGDPSAFDALVDRYSPRLYAFVWRLAGPRDAEDLVQDVFLRIVRSIGDYDHRDRFDAWVFRIALNVVRDRARRLKHAPRVSDVDANDLLEAPETSGSADGRTVDSFGGMSGVERDRLQAAVAALPDHEREVILLRHYAELTFAEIAQMLGTPLGTALARAHRGLRRLRQTLESGGLQ